MCCPQCKTIGTRRVVVTHKWQCSWLKFSYISCMHLCIYQVSSRWDIPRIIFLHQFLIYFSVWQPFHCTHITYPWTLTVHLLFSLKGDISQTWDRHSWWKTRNYGWLEEWQWMVNFFAKVLPLSYENDSKHLCIVREFDCCCNLPHLAFRPSLLQQVSF